MTRGRALHLGINARMKGNSGGRRVTIRSSRHSFLDPSSQLDGRSHRSVAIGNPSVKKMLTPGQGPHLVGGHGGHSNAFPERSNAIARGSSACVEPKLAH